MHLQVSKAPVEQGGHAVRHVPQDQVIGIEDAICFGQRFCRINSTFNISGKSNARLTHGTSCHHVDHAQTVWSFVVSADPEHLHRNSSHLKSTFMSPTGAERKILGARFTYIFRIRLWGIVRAPHNNAV